MSLTNKNIPLIASIISGILILSFLFLGLSDSKKYSFSYDNVPNILSETKSTTLGNEPINILFLGVAGEGSRGSFLTDTIFVTSIIPSKKQISMISIPRDLWVKIPNGSTGIKINSLYELENRGKAFSKANSYSLVKEKIEDVTGLPIDHIVVLDLKGLEKLIDDLGGIDIWLEKDVIDPNLVDPHNPSKIFHLSAGWRHLDGALIIKFIRTRYAPNGDFYRIEHQQQIIAALKDKLTKLADIWNLISWLKIWQSLSGHIVTNLDFNTIWQMLPVIKNISSGQIQYLSITNKLPDELLITSTMYDNWAKKNIYILVPKKGFENYEEINNYIKEKIYE